MANSGRKQTRNSKRHQPQEQYQETPQPFEMVTKRVTAPIEAKNENQKRYINAIRNFNLVFGLGPAGTGKTYIAGALAAEMLESKNFDKIIITRPAVDAGESLGFLPGEIEDKYGPYVAAFRDVLNERLGKTYVEYLIKTGHIDPQPLAYMRGRTYKNAVVILDEAQNATVEQMKLFLTRIGNNCVVIVSGDENQTDIRNSGLSDAVARLSWIPQVKVVKFGTADIVRSGLVQDICMSYENKMRV